MAKASRFYKQPKMKQKEYFEILQQRQQNADYYYGESNQESYPTAQSLHQLKKKRGAIVQRSYSDIGYRQNNVQYHHQQQQQQQQKKQQTESMLKRNSSSASNSSKRDSPKSSVVQRSYSDSVRLVQYRQKPNLQLFDNEYNHQFARSQRPNSVDLSHRQPVARHLQRPASVDITTKRDRPRSILKKASSASDLNINRSFEEDLIFDDEYLDYKSPRDILNKSGQHGSAPNLNYSFEDGISGGNVNRTRPMSPKVVKRVNFINEPTVYRTSPKSPRNALPEGGQKVDFSSPRGFDYVPRIINGDVARADLGWRVLQPELPPRTHGKPKARVQNNKGTPVKELNYNNDNNNDNDNERKPQPYEIRKPLFNTDSNVVDFGTYISKKLSKLKINKNKKKEKKPEVSKSQNGESVRTSLDGNFTMLSHTGRNNEGSPARRDNFIDQEVLY